jgi:predicted metal-binding transcription factor (methanogenesis marker protein 9)
MIEILGVKLTYDTLAWIAAFVASEIIGSSKLKENSVASLAKTMIDRMKPSRKEDDKVAEVRKATELLRETLRRLGD